MIMAERAHPPRIPRMVMGGTLAESVQDRRNHWIWLDCCQHTNQLDGIGSGDISMLTNAHFLKLQYRMVSSLPMQHQMDRVPFTPGDDLS